MTAREPRALEDESIDRALRTLFRDDGPPDLRARVEELIHEGGAARRPGVAWGLRGALTGLATLIVAILAAVAWWSGEPLEHAVRPAPPAPSIPERERSVGPDAELFASAEERPATVAPTAEARRLEPREPVQRLAASLAAWSIPDAPLLPEWAPVALGTPAAIATDDIGPRAITIEAQVVEALPDIEELAPCDQPSRVCAR